MNPATAEKSDTEEILDQMEREIETELGSDKSEAGSKEGRKNGVLLESSGGEPPAAVGNVLDCLDASTGDETAPQRAESAAP